MFSHEKLKKTLIEFLDRGCRSSISREELAKALECSRDDIVQNKKMVEDTLVEIQENKAVEDCKVTLRNLIAKGIKPTPESLADYLKISVRNVKEKQYIFDYAFTKITI